MDEDEAALLAELRAISAGAAGTSRFADTEDIHEDDAHQATVEPTNTATHPPNNENQANSSTRPTERPLPPWKRKTNHQTATKSPAKAPQVAVPSCPAPLPVVDDDEPLGGGFPKSKSNFQGERGGDAEDAALLAELQAISKQSGAAHRFSNDDNDDDNDNGFVPHHEPAADDDNLQKEATPPQSPKPTNRRPVDHHQQHGMDVLVSSHSEDQEIVSVLSEPSVFAATAATSTTGGGGFQKPTSALPNTFQGERGGAAEDDDLLAELRAISAKSSSADRFANQDDDNDNDNDGGMDPQQETKKTEAPLPPWKQKKTPTPPQPVEAPNDTSDQSSLPPWKRKAKPTAKHATVDVVVAAPPSSSAAAAAQPTTSMGGGGFQTSAVPKTFQGDRGGTAEDEDLLAELRAISSQSGSNDRFAGGADDHAAAAADNNNYSGEEEALAVPSQPQEKANSLPPWKQRKGSAKAAETDVDVVVAAPPPPKPAPASVVSAEPPVVGGFQKSSNLTNTFQGDRGGSAEDDDLLAELRAISSKSGATDRFAHSTDDDTNDYGNDMSLEPTEPAPPGAQPKKTPVKPATATTLPPWKRKAAPATKQPEVDVIVAAPAAAPPRVEPTPESLPQTGGFQKANLPNTFQGDRGGAAEDADLLAELRAISSGAGGANRFTEGDDNDHNGREAGGFGNGTPLQNDPPPSPVKPTHKAADKPSKTNALPPWKRKGKQHQPAADVDDVVVAAPQPPAKPTEQEEAPATGGFAKSNLANTFQGDRGGAAEDEDLLAELRAISACASGANRFAEDEEGESGGLDGGNAPARTSAKPKIEAALPPWKRKGNQQANKSQPSSFQDEVLVAAPPAKQQMTPEPDIQKGGFEKSNLPNTFKGDRGGAAEDEALLAELRAISSGAGGANRFRDEEEDGGPSVGAAESGAFQKSAAKPKSDAPLPPWKRKGPQNKGQRMSPPAAVAVVETSHSAPAAEDSNQAFGGFQKTSLPNTFKGDRGGAAEDEALLAELRAISSVAGGANRFSDSNDAEMGQPQAPAPSVRSKPQPPRNTKPAPAPPTPKIIETAQSTPGGAAADLTVTMDDLPGALSDRSWKIRKEAFQLLQNSLSDRVAGTEPTGEIDAGSIVEGLDALIPGMLGDSNASALDSALDFSLLYADFCRGATMSGQAEEMLAALVKGGALAASRPSTVKLTTSLVLKLIEVGDDGTASAHAVVDVLLRQGLTSKKPKIVITSAGLILDAATSFGAACLPLALVTSSAPKMLSHVNAKVRDNGMKIIAEIARALGSTSHIQGILDGMKKAQVDQLNSMIEKQPQPAPIAVGFRNKQGGQASGSPEDALAALEAGNKELEAKRFASRPAVNLVAEVAKTEYATRVTAAKWSEKVAALDMVLECGGEKPYKIMAPSSSVNYGPLISDMKKLLGNTHFAVCGKSMEVLSMLAEGVGEKLFPHLRPLLSTLLGLSKDKKLTKFINPCLDCFFGHILAFDHLLEEDAVPEATNERKQKNALARTAALDFLGRCVSRGESAGPRGMLTVKSAKNVANLSVLKLEDSDAGVRKAALGVLQNLQSMDNDEEVFYAISEIINELKKTNPRAHKTLSKTMKAPSTNAPTTRPEESKKEPPPQNTRTTQSKPGRAPEERNAVSSPKKAAPSRVEPKKGAPRPQPMATESSNDSPPLDEALEFMSQLDIPRFDESEEDDGVLAGLKGKFC